MCIIANSSLVPAVKVGISSATVVYKLYGVLNKRNSFQLKTKTKSSQHLFAEGLLLSSCEQLDYSKCGELMLKMKEAD